MKTIMYKWFEITIRYYNPAFPVGMTIETIALEAESFTDAEKRTRDLYKEFRACEILSINPTLYEEVLFSENFYEVMHWYLVELEEDPDMLQEFYQDLKDSGCDCAYLESCSRKSDNCSSAKLHDIGQFGQSYDPYSNFEANKVRYHDFSLHGDVRTIDYLDTPSCFRYAGSKAHKAFLLVQGRDFTHVLKRVKGYMYNHILDYNIWAIMQTQLLDVIPQDRCQL